MEIMKGTLLMQSELFVIPDCPITYRQFHIISQMRLLTLTSVPSTQRTFFRELTETLNSDYVEND